jgi:polysaccharide pyruvyl transferase WcaK-like protein
MKVCVVGWYGTETLGDRAILDGIFEILYEVDHKLSVALGSLYPFFTERTLMEDLDTYRMSAPGIHIDIFNIKEEKSYRENVDKADILIMGGGPLMDLIELSLIIEGFKYAKLKNIPCVLMGCGIGPIHKECYRKIVDEIIDCADAVWLRDIFSLEFIDEKYIAKTHVLGDPAVVSVEKYKKNNVSKVESYAVVNFRDYQTEEYKQTCNVAENSFLNTIEYMSDNFEKVLLLPNHTFAIGGDDRYILTKLWMSEKRSNVEVMHKPLSLYEMYSMVLNARAAIGMRYHSVLFQTILNGNNFIFNYTGSNQGKIKGFLSMHDKNNFYSNRIWDMQSEDFDLNKLKCLNSDIKFSYQCSSIKKDYINAFEEVIEVI